MFLLVCINHISDCEVQSRSIVKLVTHNPTAMKILISPIVLGTYINAATAIDAPKLGECITESNPQTTTQFCRNLGLDSNNRLQGCLANENCFATSATAATKRGYPWFYTTEKPEDAFQILKSAVELEGLKVLQTKPDVYYLLAAQKNVPKQPSGASLFYEFLLRPSDKAVLYHSVVDKTIFVYPLQQPVSDFGALNDMLNRIQIRSGFNKEVQSED